MKLALKLTKRGAVRQKSLVGALRKGSSLGGLLVGLAAASVSGCKHDDVRRPMTMDTVREAKAANRPQKPKELLSNRVREERCGMVWTLGVAPRRK